MGRREQRSISPLHRARQILHREAHREEAQHHAGSAFPVELLDDAPLTTLLMHIATFDVAAGVAQNLVQVEASIRADTLVQPLIVLAPSRPEPWPS